MKWLIIFVIASFLALIPRTVDSPVSAHHDPDGILPLAPNTAYIKNFWKQGFVTYCFDSRAANYPNFAAQQRQVVAADYARTRIPAREVPFSTNANSCNIQHTMPDESLPSGVAGTILYANWPVVVKYAWRLGYSDWKTTQGHEGTNCGHAVGEHEGYDDVKFVSHYRTYGRWAPAWGAPTVMDFGTGVWECTPADVSKIHSILLAKPVQVGGEVRRHPDGTPYTFYCGGDVGRADRVVLMVRDPQGLYHFTGITLPVRSDCPGVLLQDGPPGYCFFWNQEISAWIESWSEGNLRNDTPAGCL